MNIRFHNSKSGKKEDFQPANPKSVRIYSCGPTVYNYNHIGNFRSYAFVDILRRYLQFVGFTVDHTMNITDVDDKIIENALREHKDIEQFTEPYTLAFLEDLKLLKIQDVEHRPRATGSIPGMIDLVARLHRNGHVYINDGSVYFRLNTYPDYGSLAKLDAEHLKTAAEGRFEADEYSKEDVRDFALWKAPQRPEEPAWDSPWGKGRPGWHLDCSAMIRDIYGKDGIDIHTGGIDLLFPHHENEIAQSQCAFPGENFVRYWLHNEHLLVDGKKMSKSLGNYFTLRELTNEESANRLVLAKRAPESLLHLIRSGRINRALRYLFFSFHYRTKLNFTFDNLTAADAACERIQNLVRRLLQAADVGAEQFAQYAAGNKEKDKAGIYSFRTDLSRHAMDTFLQAMADDLNAPKALSAVFDFVRDWNLRLEAAAAKKEEALDGLLFLHAIDRIFDILEFSPEQKAQQTDLEPALVKKVEELLLQRSEAKKNRDFARADLIRKELETMSVLVIDTPDGSVWKRKG